MLATTKQQLYVPACFSLFHSLPGVFKTGFIRSIISHSLSCLFTFASLWHQWWWLRNAFYLLLHFYHFSLSFLSCLKKQTSSELHYNRLIDKTKHSGRNLIWLHHYFLRIIISHKQIVWQNQITNSCHIHNRMGRKTNVDTSMFRRAIWNYIQCIYGIRHDDYDYREVNELLARDLKKYIKDVCCFPHRVRKEDCDRVMPEFWRSEKVLSS